MIDALPSFAVLDCSIPIYCVIVILVTPGRRLGLGWRAEVHGFVRYGTTELLHESLMGFFSNK